jgi:hypothetical protein
MQIIYFIAMGLVFMQSIFMTSSIDEIDHSPAVSDAKIELSKYHLFAYSANLYIAAHPFTGTTTQTFTWNDIKTDSTIPAGATVAFPSNWMIRRNASKWAICAPLGARTVAMLANLQPADKKTITVGSTLSASYQNSIIIGEPNATEAASYASLCN